MRPKVIYVLGSQRGGTTVFGRLLGELPDAEYIGELRLLWEVSLPQARTCGCGLAHADCPLWSTVLPAVHGDHPVDELRALQQRAAPTRGSWRRIWLRRRDAPLTDDEQRYAALLEQTYLALADAHGRSVLVDGSKLPADADLVRRMTGIDAHLVHVVRDPRGVVSSMLRRETDGDGVHLAPTMRAAVTWLLRHASGERIAKRFPPGRAVRIRYEDYVAAPTDALARVAAAVGISADLAPAADGTFHIRGGHTPSDSRGVLPAMDVALRDDDRWRTQLRPVGKLLVGLVTIPLARRYGYRHEGSR